MANKKIVDNVTVGESTVSEAKTQNETKPRRTGAGTYRLRALMNVRKSPSLSGEIITTLDEGTKVKVKAVENDWLHLEDDTYVFYHEGIWAEKL